jgi:hypothetical protein
MRHEYSLMRYLRTSLTRCSFHDVSDELRDLVIDCQPVIYVTRPDHVDSVVFATTSLTNKPTVRIIRLATESMVLLRRRLAQSLNGFF